MREKEAAPQPHVAKRLLGGATRTPYRATGWPWAPPALAMLPRPLLRGPSALATSAIFWGPDPPQHRALPAMMTHIPSCPW